MNADEIKIWIRLVGAVVWVVATVALAVVAVAGVGVGAGKESMLKEEHDESTDPLQSGCNEWLCGYVIYFKDGGEPEAQVLYKGTKRSCEELMNHPALCAVSYAGSRPVDRAELRIFKCV
jgi:hypothetical protein